MVRAYFLSDAHLGAKYLPDPREAERRVVSFLDSIGSQATHIFLLGDILDYWYEYRYVVPKGFTRLFGKLAELSDRGVEITWLAGNHDIWLFGYFAEELGITTVDGSLTVKLGEKTFFLNHGDTVGERAFSFRMIQSLFRSKICQRLYSAVNPRWTIPFAYRWSRSNREKHPEQTDFDTASAPLANFARQYKETHPETDYFIFGHIHQFGMTEIAPGCEMAILGEWIDTCSYALYDGDSLTLHTYKN